MTAVDPTSETDGDTPETRPRGRLAEIRESPRRRAVALAVAVLVGVGLAWLHWVGLLFAGALVGLVSPDLPRAMVAGAGVGVLVLVVVALSLGNALEATLRMSPAIYVTVGAAVGLPLLGSLVRGIR